MANDIIFKPTSGITISDSGTSVSCGYPSYVQVETYHYTKHKKRGKIHIEAGGNIGYTNGISLYSVIEIKDNGVLLGSIRDYDIQGYKIIDIIIDLDNNTISFYRNNVFFKTVNVTFTTKEIYLNCYVANGSKIHVNFGQNDFKYPYAQTYSLYDFYNSLSLFLINTGNAYYSTTQNNYDSSSKMYTPLVLQGETPNMQEIETNAIYDIEMLTEYCTIGEETFRPIDKMYGNFEIKEYKIK